ncbi:MAG: hypothetical protein JST11_04450 [Acidobacteria bacterium]|nr:hypothetical protein [Acidobacteriota bacterium]
MTHRSKLEVWLVAAIFYVVVVLALWGDYWVGAPVLLILLILSFPHSYVLAPEGLRVRAGITRWVIPYRAITIVRQRGARVAIGVGSNEEVVLAPADPRAFRDDVAAHAPHLVPRGEQLIQGRAE